MEKIDTASKGFIVGKAAAGAILFGPVGLVGGALGKKKATYCCGAICPAGREKLSISYRILFYSGTNNNWKGW